MTPGSTAMLLRAVEEDELPTALAAALDGGAPVAPLPAEPVERARALRALRLDEPADTEAAVVVLSSGSTAEPKGVVLSAAAIRAGAAATHDRLGGPGHWLLPMPTHYVAGLMVLARAHLAGTSVVPLARDLADLRTAELPAGRRYLSVVPTQLVRALERPDLVAALAGLDAVLVGGGAADPTLLERARAAGIPCVTTYGMSETCGGCVYDGVPLAGVDVRVEPGDGRVSIAGPVLFSGYRGRPDLTAEALVDGRFRTADRARWDRPPHGTPRLQVLGRTDDVVVSGGLNVDLAAVEARGQTWPARGAAELVVVGVPHPQWGVEVVAVTDAAATAAAADDRTLAGLQSWVRAELPAYAAPRRLVVRDPLPRTSSGKVDRRRLRSDLVDPEGTR